MKVLRKIIAAIILSGTIAGEPAQAQTTIEGLPTGNHRVCSQLPTSRGMESGMCFLFRKVGDRIVGNFYIPYSSWLVCVSGKVDGNKVNGEALESSGELGSPTDPKFQGSRLENWDERGYLKLAEGRVVNRRYVPGTEGLYTAWFVYEKALLNLNGFYFYNAGSTLPPERCEMKD